ncbi:MAG: hypothetical protein SFV15_23490 [Polyangiaceae bacterium]|nr:hypothetical protein [Polyangiaceae bacterium]
MKSQYFAASVFITCLGASFSRVAAATNYYDWQQTDGHLCIQADTSHYQSVTPTGLLSGWTNSSGGTHVTRAANRSALPTWLICATPDTSLKPKAAINEVQINGYSTVGGTTSYIKNCVTNYWGGGQYCAAAVAAAVTTNNGWGNNLARNAGLTSANPLLYWTSTYQWWYGFTLVTVQPGADLAGIRYFY